MTLDHLGIAARDGARDLFARLLGAGPYKSETVETQGVRTVFFGDGAQPGAAPKLELLESVAEGSPVARFLDSRGPGLHHIAFEVDDLEGEMVRVRDLGIRLLSETPQPGADGKQIVFLHPKDTGGVLVELCMSRPPYRERVEVETGAGHVVAQVHGEDGAPPLLALHGAMGTSAQFSPFVAAWARSFRVLVPDLPAHGESHDADPLTWTAMVEAVAALLVDQQIETVDVVGYSMGAGVALHLAAQHPGKVHRQVLHTTHVQWSHREVERMVTGLHAARHDPPTRAKLAAIHGEAVWPRMIDRVEAFSEGLPEAWLTDDEMRGIEVPTLVSVGDADALFEVEASLHLSRTLPEARLWVQPGVTHALASLDAEAFAQAVAGFLLPRASAS